YGRFIPNRQRYPSTNPNHSRRHGRLFLFTDPGKYNEHQSDHKHALSLGCRSHLRFFEQCPYIWSRWTGRVETDVTAHETEVFCSSSRGVPDAIHPREARPAMWRPERKLFLDG